VPAVVPVPVRRLSHRDDKPIDIALDGSTKREVKPSADRIRVRALDACDRAQWQECIDGLTAARALDPEGDADPRVQAAWRSAQRALAPQPQGGTVRDLKDPQGPR